MKRIFRKQRVLIVVLWLAFMVLANILFYYTEQHIYSEKAQKVLLDQADVIVGQLTSIVEDDYYSRRVLSEMPIAKAKALELALEPYDNIEDARALLDEFAQSAGIEGLAVYDRSGTQIYRSRDDCQFEFNRDVLIPMLDRGELNDDSVEELSEEYLNAIFTYDDSELENWCAWGVKKRWVLIMKDEEITVEKQIRDYFNWANVLRRIRIGSNGFLVAVDRWYNPGTVLSCRGEDTLGNPVEALDIRLNGRQQAASLDALLTAFENADRVVRVKMAGKDYYAVRAETDGVLLLALLPMEEVRSNAAEMAGILFTLTALATGLYMLYAAFHTRDGTAELEPKGKSFGDKLQSFRLRARGLLAIASLLVLCPLLTMISLYAETFTYCQSKVGNVLELIKSNDEAYGTMSEWAAKEYLTKCNIAECILKHTSSDAITPQYLDRLSAALAIRNIHIYDANGNIMVTNDRYDNTAIDKESPLYDLLKGRAFLVEEAGLNPYTDELSQRISVAMTDSEDQLSSIVTITADPMTLRKIYENLDADSVFKQISLNEDTLVMVVRDADMQIEYLAKVDDSAFVPELESFDYTGYSVSAIGISEDRLRDNYNGNMLVLQNRYFASVRRNDGNYYLVMRPRIALVSAHLIPVAIAVLIALLFALILVPVCCVKSGDMPEDGHEEETPAPEDNPDRKSGWEEEQEALYATLMEKKNYGFSDRWLGDGVKWKDKTQDEKYTTASRWIVLIVLAVIFIQAMIAGQNSIWYYCVTGHWDSGVNLYSVTSCIITIFALMLIKLVSHKVFYLIACAVNARGETICHLIDNLMGYVLFIVGVFACLSQIGVNTTALSLTGGIAGVIFGIGCQNVVADILAGIIMTFSGDVRVGDYVCYNGTYGSVMSIGVRTTKIKRYGDLTVVRNNDLKNFINMTTSRSEARISLYLNIDLRESLEHVEEVIARELPLIQENAEKVSGTKVNGLRYRGVTKINDTGMSLSFVVFCPGYCFVRVLTAMNRELKLMFDRNNIRIALPQVEVHGLTTETHGLQS